MKRRWQLLLPQVDPQPSELDNELFDAMLALEQQRLSQHIKWDEVSEWDVDQDRETLILQFEDELPSVTARPQIIGTFDGSEFMWAWNNPSVEENLQRDSQAMRDAG